MAARAQNPNCGRRPEVACYAIANYDLVALEWLAVLVSPPAQGGVGAPAPASLVLPAQDLAEYIWAEPPPAAIILRFAIR